ncbi:MAG TPA: peptidylprolyl isomerase, partial [Candidatus Rifleibacterium sp.]|nr:peptidylprolyl isomerase [Candidatus Rifleibacterium sp.]
MLNYILIALLAIAPMAMAQVPEGVTLEKATNPVIKITTSKGEMVLELYPDVAPKHVESMLNLIRKGFYNGLAFHRVVPGFVIQGG